MNQIISVCELMNLYLYHNSEQKTSREYTLKIQNQYKTTFFSPLLVEMDVSKWAVLDILDMLGLKWNLEGHQVIQRAPERTTRASLRPRGLPIVDTSVWELLSKYEVDGGEQFIEQKGK